MEPAFDLSAFAKNVQGLRSLSKSPKIKVINLYFLSEDFFKRTFKLYFQIVHQSWLVAQGWQPGCSNSTFYSAPKCICMLWWGSLKSTYSGVPICFLVPILKQLRAWFFRNTQHPPVEAGPISSNEKCKSKEHPSQSLLRWGVTFKHLNYILCLLVSLFVKWG